MALSRTSTRLSGQPHPALASALSGWWWITPQKNGTTGCYATIAASRACSRMEPEPDLEAVAEHGPHRATRDGRDPAGPARTALGGKAVRMSVRACSQL